MKRVPPCAHCVLTFLSMIALLCVGAGCAATGNREAGATRVYVVRHAEKQSGVTDPGLTPEGIARAERLAELCAQAGVVAVYSTTYRRTMATAAPTAALVGTSVDTSFGPREEERLARRIREKHAGASVLVVGHSNTVGAIVGALGAERPADLDEDEYDRLFVVRLFPDGRARLERRRYGATAR